MKRVRLEECEGDEGLNTYVNDSFCVESATDVSHSTCAFVDDVDEEFEPECTSSMIDPEESYEEDWPREEEESEEEESEEEYESEVTNETLLRRKRKPSMIEESEEEESEVTNETLLRRKRKPINFYYESSIDSYNTSDEYLYSESEDDVSCVIC